MSGLCRYRLRGCYFSAPPSQLFHKRGYRVPKRLRRTQRECSRPREAPWGAYSISGLLDGGCHKYKPLVSKRRDSGTTSAQDGKRANMVVTIVQEESGWDLPNHRDQVHRAKTCPKPERLLLHLFSPAIPERVPYEDRRAGLQECASYNNSWPCRTLLMEIRCAYDS